MSYAPYYSKLPLSLPKGLGFTIAGWLYINVFNGKPAFYTKELSKAEFNATPTEYLMNPEHHYVRFPKVPGQATVSDGLAALQHAAHAKGHH